jgi:prepilin-type N-terminal cleavage/methylation domain-containing protein
MARLHTSTRPATARAGFTLIELLIAVLIIGILATLVTLGVSKAMSYAKQVATKTEMGQIEQALGVAAIEMGRVPYIPSYIKLCYSKAGYTQSSPDQMSLRILTQMFPNAWTGPNGLEDWNGPNKSDPANGIIELKADRAFVFFLRGPDGNGFSAKGPVTSNPQGGKRFGPYYEFKSERLNFGNDGLASYRDYWDNPGANMVVYSQMMVGQTSPSQHFDLLAAPVPGRQLQAANKYFMPKGYQILSAGKDGKWGAYTTPVFTGNLVGDGEDDQSNFADEPHGKPIAD